MEKKTIPPNGLTKPQPEGHFVKTSLPPTQKNALLVVYF